MTLDILINSIESWAENLKDLPQHKKDDALYDAVILGSVAHTKVALEQGADIHSNSGMALFFAAEFDHLDVLKLLINKGANIKSNGPRCLAGAVGHGAREVVEFLLYNKDKFGIKEESIDRAIEIAQEKNKTHVVDTIEDLKEKLDSLELGYIAGVLLSEASLQDLRDVNVNNENGFAIAAKLDVFDRVIEAAYRDNKDKITKEDLLSKDKFGTKIINILGEKKKADIAFPVSFWSGRKNEMMEVYKELHEEYKHQVNIKGVLNHMVLKERVVKRNRFKK